MTMDIRPVGDGMGGERYLFLATCGGCNREYEAEFLHLVDARRALTGLGWRLFATHGWRCPDCQDTNGG